MKCTVEVAIPNGRQSIFPILTTIFLIVIAIASVTVTYAWITTYRGDIAGTTDIMVYNAGITFTKGPTESIVITLGNSGSSEVTITAVYYGTSESELVSAGIYKKVIKSEDCFTNITINTKWIESTTYYFKILTTIGNPLVFNVKTPQYQTFVDYV